jgi:voltage-gated potassium channel Kch
MWYRQYFAAIYFSLMTMTTVGYGDIYPQNDIERIVDALMMVFDNSIN